MIKKVSINDTKNAMKAFGLTRFFIIDGQKNGGRKFGIRNEERDVALHYAGLSIGRDER